MNLIHSTHTFPSGLRVVTIPMPATQTATVLVLVGTGSKYEAKEIGGISHFLEHMMFKGTERRPGPLDIARELDGIGADYNAFTGKELTGYYAKASIAKLDVITDVVFDIFQNSLLDATAIEREKGPVIEEINMDKDNPMRHVGDVFEGAMYGDQPAGWDIGGTKESVAALTRDQVADYFHSHYVAANTVIAVAGNVTHEDIVERVTKAFARIREATAPTKLATTHADAGPVVRAITRDTDQTHFILGLRGIDLKDERRYAMGIASTILGGGMSSRLFTEIREKRGLAYYVGSRHTAYTDSGYLMMRAGVSAEKVHEAATVMLEQCAQMAHEGVSSEELQRAKDNMEGSLVLGLEHSDTVADAYAMSWLLDATILTPAQELDKMKAVTSEDVRAVMREILSPERAALALIGPQSNEAALQELITQYAKR
ncbi:MAG: pitrilysin family protein [Patescibacteria group bacterium]